MLFEGRPRGLKGGRGGCGRAAGCEGRGDGQKKPTVLPSEHSPEAKQGAMASVSGQGVLESALKVGGIPSIVLQRSRWAERQRHSPKATQLVSVRAPVGIQDGRLQHSPRDPGFRDGGGVSGGMQIEIWDGWPHPRREGPWS